MVQVPTMPDSLVPWLTLVSALSNLAMAIAAIIALLS